MANVNITEVRLLNVPLENDYKHTLHFDSVAEQTAYFTSKAVRGRSDFSYNRKDATLRYPAKYDALIGTVNYIMYRNEYYGNKWFYAFITDMEYINDGMTAIQFKTDVLQTWLFDYKVKPSFVEREHTADDTIGVNTLPEQVETGEYCCNSQNKNVSLILTNVIMGCTVELNSEELEPCKINMYNGVYSGVKYYVMTGTKLKRAMEVLEGAGKSDAIVSIFVAPNCAFDYTFPEGAEFAEVNPTDLVTKLDWVNTFGTSDTQNEKPVHLDGYVPHNNKLFTYPYCYMLMSNNAGGASIYKYERFTSTSCRFNIYCALTPGMSIRLVPKNYNGIAENYEEGLNLGKMPICAWSNDVYTNWLTQNAVNVGVSVASSLLQVGAGVALMATGAGAMAGAGSITSGLLGVAGSVGSVYQHSLQPPQAEGNINNGDVNFSSKNLTFTAYQMTVKREYAVMIDSFFDMFGYKTAQWKVPNKKHRAKYWYTKTIDVNIDGAIPANDMQEIKNCYNNGVTFWVNPSEIGNYTIAGQNVVTAVG